MIILNASAAVVGLLNQGDTRRLMADEALAAPHLVDAEILHALRRQVTSGTISETEAKRALETWQRLGVTRYPLVGLLDRMWELRENLSSYDAAYVALAEALSHPLATADARLSRAPGPTCQVLVVRG